MSGEPPAAPSACPDEAEIAEFVQGELLPEPAHRLEAHLDECQACAQVVAELVRIFEASSAAAPAESEPYDECGAEPEVGLRSEEMAVTLGGEGTILGPKGSLLRAGAEVGRYRVLNCVGVGGMGVVYAAYDPELDRRIALKLLRGSNDEAGSQGRNARLQREAQALARLTHPNVITVHDVGAWEGQVFVAMEYVDGPTLKQWMAKPGRSWPEIREVFVAAGRGLAAAHEADLVHRDFKPDNVLIGTDGRVCVTDFGLARWGRPAGSTADLLATDELAAARLRSSSSGPISVNPEVSLTRTGTLVGTPAYMAPEQHEHQPADRASDQFAFCVALYEAIYGQRPFKGRTLAQLSTSVLEGAVPEGTTALAVPRAVRLAIRRGLSRSRRERFASMDALLAVLEQRPAPRRWPWLAAVGASGAALMAVIWSAAGTAAQPSAFCQPGGGLEPTWNDSRREAIEAAFERTGVSYAASSAKRALAAVEEYAMQWEELRERSCGGSSREDDAGRIEEGPALVALRERCLERRRVSLQALLEAFEQADASTVARAVGAVAGLPQLDRCADSESLMAEVPPPPPSELRDAVEAVRDDLARGEGLLAAGRYQDGLALAREADATAEALGHRPLRAETQVMLGEMLDRVGEAEAAVAILEEAELSAVASRHRRMAVRALLAQVYVLGLELSEVERAERLARRAEAEIYGADMDDALSALWLNRGSVAYRKGDYSEAEAFIQKALALRDRDKQPLRWADAAFNLAAIQMVQGDLAEAVEGIEDYVEVFEAQLGRMHPEVASGYYNLGVTYSHQGRLDDAIENLERAEAIRRVTLGSDHPEYAQSLNMVGSVRISQGQTEQGMALVLRSIEILEKNGAAASQLTFNRIELATALLELSRIDEAQQQATMALETVDEQLGPDHPQGADARAVLAGIAAVRKDVVEVEQQMDRVESIRRAALGDDHPDIFMVRVERARLLAKAGRFEQGEEQLRGLLHEVRGTPGDATAAARMALAEVLWERVERRDEARTFARRIVEVQRVMGNTRVADVAQEWLDEHPQAEGEHDGAADLP